MMIIIITIMKTNSYRVTIIIIINRMESPSKQPPFDHQQLPKQRKSRRKTKGAKDDDDKDEDDDLDAMMTLLMMTMHTDYTAL